MRDEEGIIIRPTSPLVSQNEISRWYFAMWIGTIAALGALALVAFSIPKTIQRVNDAYQEMPK
jgi:hypothetical protein